MDRDLKGAWKEFEFYKQKYEEVFVICTEHFFYNNLGDETDIKKILEKENSLRKSFYEIIERKD